VPTYVYACTACEETYELEQRITEDAIKVCRCGSEGTVKRVIQPVGIAFKGSGFYVNDSVAKTSPKEGPAENKAETETAGAEKPAAEKSAAETTAEAATPAPTTTSEKPSVAENKS
jgi:putative FmdB family regulatory protein